MYCHPAILIFLLLFGAAKNSLGQTAQRNSQLVIHTMFPAYLRPGDAIELQASVRNKGGKEITGQASLQLMDSATGNAVDGWFNNIFPSQFFTTEPNDSVRLRFPVTVPVQFTSTLQWALVLTADSMLLPQASGFVSVPHYSQNDTTEFNPSSLPKGFRLTKQFFSVKNGKASAKPLDAFAAIRQGDVVEVAISISIPRILSAVTLTDEAPAVLKAITAPRSAVKIGTHQATRSGMRMQSKQLAAGTYQARYRCVAAYIGNFHCGALQLQAKNLTTPLLFISETKLQVTE